MSAELKLSDSPFAVGTPEHSDWVRNEFIPAVRAERSTIDRARYGAESQGRKLIHESSITFHIDINWPGVTESLKALREAFQELGDQLGLLPADLRRWIGELAKGPNPTLAIIASQRKRRHR